MADIIYRAARATDAQTIAAIHVASWRDAYRSILDPAFLAEPVEEDRLSHWLGKLDTPALNFMVEIASTSDEGLVGFVATHRDLDRRWGSLVDNLHVRPEMRGRKIGEALLRSAARKLAAQQAGNGLYLWVFEANEAALRFYERMGGQVVEQAISQIPAANGRTILRVHWPTLSDLC
ncbi:MULTISPECIES: GNAT family N-acetyltransferase [unclassified Methylobacterium]|uniref:GNAT family N-acetyltransferase n=1 Tax=unclassified Methylobacterium TaxID=2615210 RepID=UPI0011C1DEFC|nr:MULTISPECIES: GNAT family N-acetyltransferase [unclassified Methylobacterium]QEE38439.1 GNAT family N-acetyltransferase [Methylobacterium sp. WL1]TXN03434.1 GNAT family N-acetyltransferase [Methylobacterium sp. WL64]TXN52369.1 GNAT family N-acetyltransferase [Methylobacterium sp. WL2]